MVVRREPRVKIDLECESASGSLRSSTDGPVETRRLLPSLVGCCRGGIWPRMGDELAPFELQARGSIGTSRSPEKRREQHRDDDEDEGRRS